MATNPFFNFTTFKGEQNLIQDLTIETIKMAGQDVYYIPRQYYTLDKIFGEDPTNCFSKTYTIEMYIASVSGFEGNDNITAFGNQIPDKVSLVVARKRFAEEVTQFESNITRPREGDLIYLPLSKSLFEINFTEHEIPLYPLGKLYTYQITAELFTYSYEQMSTPKAEVNEPYTTTTAGVSGSTIIPLANILGTTYGVNDTLASDAAGLSFDANDPFGSCEEA